MQGLRIFSRSGGAPTSEEIEAAHRVANTHREMRFGVVRASDKTNGFGVEVEYYPLKKIAFTSGGIAFFYSASVAAECQCRSLLVTNKRPLRPVYTIIDEGSVYDSGVITITRSWYLYDHEGELVNSGTGTQVWYTTAPGQPSVYTNFPVGISTPSVYNNVPVPPNPNVIMRPTTMLAAIYNGSATNIPDDPPFTSFSSSGSFTSLGYEELLAAIPEELIATVIHLDDGSIIDTILRTDDFNGNYTNLAFNLSWTGGTTITLKNRVGGVDQPDTVLEYEIPEDVCLVPTFYAGYAQSLERFREFKISCSETAIMRLANGDLPLSIRKALKEAHPSAKQASMAVTPVINVIDEVIVNDIQPDTASYTIQRTVEFSYTRPDGSINAQTIIGTAAFLMQNHKTVRDDTYLSYSVTFDNYIAIAQDADVSDGQRGIAVLGELMAEVPMPSNISALTFNAFDIEDFYAVLIRNTNYDPLAFAINGNAVRTSSGAVFAGGRSISVYNDGLLGLLLTPPVPEASNTIVTSMFEALIQYREDYKKPIKNNAIAAPFSLSDLFAMEGVTSLGELYATQGANTEAGYLEAVGYDTMADLLSSYDSVPPIQPWLDSAPLHNENVTIYPVIYISEILGELGMYPADQDYEDITGIKLTKGYRFTYDFTEGQFNFSEEVPIIDPSTAQEVSELILTVAPTLTETVPDIIPNLIIKSARVASGFGDLDYRYRSQATAIVDKYDPLNVTLFGLYDILN